MHSVGLDYIILSKYTYKNITFENNILNYKEGGEVSQPTEEQRRKKITKKHMNESVITSSIQQALLKTLEVL